MKITKLLRYSEFLLLIGIIVTPIIFFSTAFIIGAGPAKVDLREGDIVQLTLSDFSFEYNLSEFENYTVTPGIYLNPIINFKEGEEYDPFDENLDINNIILFEGNSSLYLQYNFHVESLSKMKTIANVTLDSNNRKFALGLFNGYQGPHEPFFEPSLSIGLTFRSENEDNKICYVHWRDIYIFSTTHTRYALNWHSRNAFSSSYRYAKEGKDIFSSSWFHDGKFLAYTTYKLKIGSNKLQEVSSMFIGREYFSNPILPRSSNISIYAGLPTSSYWNYNFDLRLKYFRGGLEI